MNYTITKLDRRHSWHDDFKWMIEFRRQTNYAPRMRTGVLEFDQCRRWFNEKFGWSQDVETRAEIIKTAALGQLLDAFNERWAYSIKYNDYRIYVTDEATLNWFTLSHPRNDHER